MYLIDSILLTTLDQDNLMSITDSFNEKTDLFIVFTSETTMQFGGSKVNELILERQKTTELSESYMLLSVLTSAAYFSSSRAPFLHCTLSP